MHERVNYSLIMDTDDQPVTGSDFSIGKRQHDAENGVTPVDIEVGNTDHHLPTTKRERTMSVDGVTQTAHGSIIIRPSLHIPGETGELAGLEEVSSEDGVDNVAIATPEKMKQLYAKFKAKKIRFKLVFTVSVISMLMLAYSSVLFPWFLGYYHTIVFPILFIIRLIFYTQSDWQLFCLDFCYFGNLGLLIYIWAYPQSEAVFAVMFGAVNGPMAAAVLIFRNSIVFHDYDRMTSAYIHLVPLLMTYLIRWFPKECSVNWYFQPTVLHEQSMYGNGTDHYLPNWVEPSVLWISAIPLLWFFIHQVLYMLIENFILNDPKYLTSYKWLSSNQGTAVYKMLTCCSRCTQTRQVKGLWLLFNILYSLLSVIGARLVYEYFIAHTIYTALLFTVAIYNGASFFIDVFAKRGLNVSND